MTRRTRCLGLLALGIAGGAGLLAVGPEIPRWSGDGALAYAARKPLPPRGLPGLATPRGGRLVCQGDSNVLGKPRVADPFCAVLAGIRGFSVEQRGHGGDTTRQGAARWPGSNMQGDPPADLVILLYGTNDAAPRAWLGRRRAVPLADYRDQLAALARAYKARGARVLVLAPLPSASDAMERRLQPYRHAAREAASIADCAFLDPVDAFAVPDAQPGLHRDGLHLNQRGHRALGRWLAVQLGHD